MRTGPGADHGRPQLKVFVTRQLPAKVEARMAELCDVTLNPEDKKLDHDELLEAMRNFDVLVPTVTDRIDAALIEAAGGLPADAGKVINGGPMMGRAMVNLASPVTKGCSGITVMSGRDAQRREASQCIKCAKCVAACPMGLEPYYLSKMTQKKGWDELEALMITSCIECGCCQSTCPAYLPLLDWVRLGKQTVMGIIRARAAAPKK